MFKIQLKPRATGEWFHCKCSANVVDMFYILTLNEVTSELDQPRARVVAVKSQSSLEAPKCVHVHI